jgi:hypothetical protein
MKITPFMGLNGFHWWQGVVENVMDPLKIGRVQVRLFGIHSAEKIPNDSTGQGIPTAELPWAAPSSSVDSAGTSGVGTTPTGLVNGSHVWGFSRDGRDYMDLVVVGSFAGIPKFMSTGVGFEDPNSIYPTRVGESDLSRLSRGDEVGTWVEKHNKAVLDNPLFVEPKSSFASKYPFNMVKETRSGHTMEMDDTPNAERLAWTHKTGSFREVHPTGMQSEHIQKERYSVVLGDDFMHVGGDVKIYVVGNVTQVIEGSVTQKVYGNVEEEIKGNKTTKCTGTINMSAAKVVINAPIETNSTINSLGDQIAGSVSTQKHTHKYFVPLHKLPKSPTDPAAGGGSAPNPPSTDVSDLPSQVPSPN